MRAEKKWVVKPAGDAEKVKAISLAYNIEPPLANLLFQRGIETPEEVHRFFNPKLEELHDPYLMQDMLKAVERIDKALRDKEKIMVYGDYDVDGISAVALLYNFLLKQMKRTDCDCKDRLFFYIPDRYVEGYGVSEKAIDYAADKGISLIITLDCGIKANAKVLYAKQRNIDFIICDHHLPGESLPEAVAVLDPKREDCKYPFKHLSGCGVGFKLIHAFALRHDLPFSEIEDSLDLVAVSIAADIVPIIGENRILAHYGLDELNKSPNLGLEAVINMSGLEGTRINIDDIIFKIGPRINAAGRMEIDIDPDDSRAQSGGRTAVRLLTATSRERALHYVQKIDEFNKERKSIDRNITEEAHTHIEENAVFKGKKSTIIYNPNWMKGVVGIVASRLIETYYRPTVVLTLSNGMITGSARSIPGFDLYEAVESCADLLENYGGHTYAAGLTLKPENLEKFKERFESYVANNITEEQMVQQVDIDMELNLSSITPKFRRQLQRFEPFGPGNPAPVFVSRKLVDDGRARLVGLKSSHLKMNLMHSDDRRMNTFEAIAFGNNEPYGHIKSGGSIDACYTLNENEFRGRITPQLRIIDMIKNPLVRPPME